MGNSGDLEQALQDGNIFRQLNALIVAHLRHHNLSQVCFCYRSSSHSDSNFVSLHTHANLDWDFWVYLFLDCFFKLWNSFI